MIDLIFFFSIKHYVARNDIKSLIHTHTHTHTHIYILFFNIYFNNNSVDFYRIKQNRLGITLAGNEDF
jgi:hypothetical protein